MNSVLNPNVRPDVTELAHIFEFHPRQLMANRRGRATVRQVLSLSWLPLLVMGIIGVLGIVLTVVTLINRQDASILNVDDNTAYVNNVLLAIALVMDVIAVVGILWFLYLMFIPQVEFLTGIMDKRVKNNVNGEREYYLVMHNDHPFKVSKEQLDSIERRTYRVYYLITAPDHILTIEPMGRTR